MTTDDIGTTLVKLVQGPMDGQEFTANWSLSPTLIFPHGDVDDLVERAVCGLLGSDDFTATYHLVHIEPSHNVLPAEAHYLYEAPDG